MKFFFVFMLSWIEMVIVHSKTSASIQEKEMKVIGMIEQRMVKTFQRKEKEKKQNKSLTAK
ncbi:MAG: hypothetical protein QE271_06185 [Bacteriovoracaceae bacterium]|nr:hypothetical protein [Bacteriovoracaceae bacterium]